MRTKFSKKCARENLRALEKIKFFSPYLTSTYKFNLLNFYRKFVRNAQVFSKGGRT
jgi:hypothetical protein